MFHPRLPGNALLQALRARFGALTAASAPPPPAATILLVCFTNRCGSNYLGELLAMTGQLNVPLECLNPDEIIPRADAAGLGLAEALAAQMRETMRAGRFALKVAPEHLEILGEAGLLAAWRGRLRCLHIERLDRLAQAISWDIAEQTGHWSSKFEHLPAPAPSYDRARLLRALARFADSNRHFDQFFGENGLTPQHVTYEALDADPAATLARLLHELGLPPVAIDPAACPIRRQSRPLNAAWRARFLAGL